ncbi:unnamed protein product [Cylicocyclus nassatus]|uniref:Uncharacterized protein n=1 Tax=Cylicocyclus nassatus TaxID=53992 RepID=A0AA36GN96_CYLNA|nr:unnamed protein product [Cylicocyclus nassatus]
MSSLRLLTLCLVLAVSEIAVVNARYEGIPYISDPVELLMRDSYSSLRNLRDHGPYKRPYRHIQKRRFSAFPSFYSDTWGFDSNTLERRHNSLPYTNLLFGGR